MTHVCVFPKTLGQPREVKNQNDPIMLTFCTLVRLDEYLGVLFSFFENLSFPCFHSLTLKVEIHKPHDFILNRRTRLKETRRTPFSFLMFRK